MFCENNNKLYISRHISTINFFRYKCKEFGKQFKYDNGSFYPYLEVSCQADLTWKPDSILHNCECKRFFTYLYYFIFISLAKY